MAMWACQRPTYPQFGKLRLRVHSFLTCRLKNSLGPCLVALSELVSQVGKNKFWEIDFARGHTRILDPLMRACQSGKFQSSLTDLPCHPRLIGSMCVCVCARARSRAMVAYRAHLITKWRRSWLRRPKAESSLRVSTHLLTNCNQYHHC